MDIGKVMKFLDNAMYAKTGGGLSELQRKILEGTLAEEGKTYAEIAENYGCEERTVSDVGYELFRDLSRILGRKVGKRNFKETMDKGNFNIFLGQVNNFENNIENITNNVIGSIGSNIPSSSLSRKTIMKLKQKYGMSNEAIADVLDIPLEDVQRINLDE